MALKTFSSVSIIIIDTVLPSDVYIHIHSERITLFLR